MCGPSIVTEESSFGDVPTEGPCGVEVLDRRSAGVDLEAIFAKAAALSGSFRRVVRSDLRETRLGFESTRWNNGALVVFSPLSDWSSSHSSSSSSSSSESSSIALSSLSSSSSESSKTSSSSCDLLFSVRDSISSLNESCFLLLLVELLSPAVSELCLAGDDMWLSKEPPSFSSDDPVPSMNMAPFFGSLVLLGIDVFIGIGVGAR